MTKRVKVGVRMNLQIFRDRRGEYRWRLRARNGRIVATGESHPRKRDAKRAFATVASLIVGAMLDAMKRVRKARRRR